MGVAFMFRCTACALELADGVDYTWCPKCSGPVERTGIGGATPRTVVPTPRRVGVWLLHVLLGLQAGFALVDPHAFPYLKPIVVIALIAAIPGAIAAFAFIAAVRGLLDERTRIVHGLEHATLALLEERNVASGGGVSFANRFEIYFHHDGHVVHLDDAIRTAANDAIRLVHGGRRELAYSPLCGTSYLVGIVALSLAVAAVAGVAVVSGAATGYVFAAMVAAGALARVAARPLGLAAQRALTVSTRFASARVGAIEREISVDGARVYYSVAVDVEPVPSRIAEPV
jgi:hypothetical protein